MLDLHVFRHPVGHQVIDQIAKAEDRLAVGSDAAF